MIKFEKPNCEIVSFANDVITTSGCASDAECGCNIGVGKCYVYYPCGAKTV